MKTEFNGKIYDHEMDAERQRGVAVSLKALHMMQEHHSNRFLSFKCVSRAEEAEWYAKAEQMVPPIASRDSAKAVIEATLPAFKFCAGCYTRAECEEATRCFAGKLHHEGEDA